jgi:DNA-directed RNA polymerase IV and V subunit 7
MVFLEAEMKSNVLISPDQLTPHGLLLRKAIITRLLEDVTNKKASKEYGYFIAITSLNSIGEGQVRALTGEVLFPVNFSCLTQKPSKGEVLTGTVDKILKHGLFVKSGLVENIFISEKMTGDYKYVPGENPVFLSEKLSKLEKGVSVRFKVVGFRWMEADRHFQLLATLAGDFLGPI